MGMRIASKWQRAESLRPPLAYAADLLRVCLRDKAIAASLIACQVLLLLPMIVGFPMNEEAINRDRALSMLGIVRNELSAYKDEFPEELYDLTQQQYRHYSDAVAAKYPSKEFFRAMAAASEVEDAEQRAGYLTGDNMHNAYAKLFDGLVSIDGTPVYATAADLPALEYLSFALGLMPAIVVLLPAVVATTSILRRLRGQTLLAHAPIGRAARRAVATMASIACAAAATPAIDPASAKSSPVHTKDQDKCAPTAEPRPKDATSVANEHASFFLPTYRASIPKLQLQSAAPGPPTSSAGRQAAEMHATSRGANTQSPAARAEATTKASETRAAARAANTKRVPCARPATSATEQAPGRAAAPQRGACGMAVLFVRPEQAATSPRPKASSIWPARTASINPPAQAAPTGSAEPNTNKYGSGAAIGQCCGALGSTAACWKGDSSSRDPTPSFFAALDCRFLTVDGLMPI